MKIVFLDCDGVLNDYDPNLNIPDEYMIYSTVLKDNCAYWDKRLVDRLAAFLIRYPEVKIVVSSTWRKSYETTKEMAADFESMGIPPDRIIDMTTWRFSSTRGEEIRFWLYKREGIDKFCILDDTADMSKELQKHLVRTDEMKGLQDADVEKMRIMLELE